MTDRLAQLIALRDALVKATGPDRVIDVKLVCLCGPYQIAQEETPTMLGLLVPKADPENGWPLLMRDVKKFTTSIDAAVTLVPTEVFGRQSWVWDRDEPTRWIIVSEGAENTEHELLTHALLLHRVCYEIAKHGSKP
jgi:hypothetical protein